MIVFLDTNIVIYLIEDPPTFGPQATPRITSLLRAGATFAVSDLVRLECRVHPIRTADATLLRRYEACFASTDIQVLPLTAAVCDQAAMVRATHGFKTPDALHLAAAIVHKCDKLLTNDGRLSACTQIPIEIL